MFGAWREMNNLVDGLDWIGVRIAAGVWLSGNAQRQTAVTAYLKSKQLPPFVSADPSRDVDMMPTYHRGLPACIHTAVTPYNYIQNQLVSINSRLEIAALLYKA